MSTRTFWRVTSLVLALTLVLSLAAATSGWLKAPPAEISRAGVNLTLARPAVLAAQAAANSEIGVMLDEEAGISAWLDADMPIDLSDAATVYRVIEDQTDEYIIGSVQIPSYPEHWDAHVYTHVDGWFLAYYLNDDPASKMISVYDPRIDTTNLASAIAVVAGAVGAPTAGINYYDFRYPNATNILLVYEDTANGNDFTINMPDTFAYYERSFALNKADYSPTHFFAVDGVAMSAIYDWNNDLAYGIITAGQLTPGVNHVITVGGNSDEGILLVTYREP